MKKPMVFKYLFFHHHSHHPSVNIATTHNGSLRKTSPTCIQVLCFFPPPARWRENVKVTLVFDNIHTHTRKTLLYSIFFRRAQKIWRSDSFSTCSEHFSSLSDMKLAADFLCLREMFNFFLLWKIFPEPSV